MNKSDKILSDKDASTNIAVKNLQVSKKFYEETLGLRQIGAEEEELRLQEWKYHDLCLSISKRRDQQGHSRNMGCRR